MMVPVSDRAPRHHKSHERSGISVVSGPSQNKLPALIERIDFHDCNLPRHRGEITCPRALLQCSLTPWYDPPLLNVQWASRQRPAIYPSKEAGFDSAFAITRRQKLIP